jgi:DNA invertase Pin-like site-specific DNA recombinase
VTSTVTITTNKVTKERERTVKVVGYVRVSTERQADEGMGLDLQEAAIRDYCQTNGHRLVEVFTDEGISGALSERPGLGAALALLEQAGADGLVVYRLDRLARSLIHQETVVERLASRGRRVLSVSEADVDGEDPTRVLVRQVLGAIAQYERALIVARMKAGRTAKAARGGYAGGAPPYGRRAVRRELRDDPKELKAVERVCQLRADGRSLRQIAAALTAEGFTPKRGLRWHPNTIRRILNREVIV